MTRRDNGRWVVLGVTYIAIIASAVAFQNMSPLLPLIRPELGFSYAQAGLLMGVFSAAGMFLALPAGVLIDRHQARTIAMVSLGLLIMGSGIVALSHTFLWFGVGRFIGGIGHLVVPLLAAQMVARAFADRELGLALGIQTTAAPVGYIINLTGLAAVGAQWGWRPAIVAGLVIGLVALVAMRLGIPPSPPARDDKPSLSWRQLGGGRLIWLLALAGLWLNAALIAALTFTPDFLTGLDYSLTTAGLITGLLMLGIIVVSPIAGFTVDRLKTKEGFVALGSVIMALAFVALPVAGPYLIPLMLGIAAAAAFVWVSIVALTPDVIPAEKLGLGFGVTAAFMNAGGLVGPWLVGLVRDYSGSYNVAFTLLAAFCLLTVGQIAWLYRERRAVVEVPVAESAGA